MKRAIWRNIALLLLSVAFFYGGMRVARLVSSRHYSALILGLSVVASFSIAVCLLFDLCRWVAGRLRRGLGDELGKGVVVEEAAGRVFLVVLSVGLFFGAPLVGRSIVNDRLGIVVLSVGWVVSFAIAFCLLIDLLRWLVTRGEPGREELRCVKCGYDLGASEFRCPECGTPFFRAAAE